MTNDLWQRAASFAARAHQGQVRKDGVTPFIAHPFRVAMTVRHVFGVDDPQVLCAALLHDTIEDTPVDYDDIEEGFGKDVAEMVACLTKDMRLPEPKREPEYDARLAKASWQTRLIKLADVYDNLSEADSGKVPKGKLIEKARRAIHLAGSDPQLQKAVSILQSLVDGNTK